MITDGEPRSSGLFHSFRRLSDTALAAVQNRVELLAVELAEEKRWLVGALAWTAAAIFLCALALLTITATIVALCPPEARGYVLIGFSVVYAGAAIFALSKARTHAKDREIPLSSTISELKKDLAALRSED